MRAEFPGIDTQKVLLQIEAAPGIERVRQLSDSFAEASPETLDAIISEASKYALAYLSPLNDEMDKTGCTFSNGQVITVDGHKAAYDAFVEGGWTTLDAPTKYDGQQLPRIATIAVQEVFDRHCPSFGMMVVSQRSAVKLIDAWGTDEQKSRFIEKLVSGEWGATICVSEVGAGSDAGRISTMATPNEDGSYSLTGEKCWISFGGHDLADTIVHCVVARTPNMPNGTQGLSLFLVPDRHEDGSSNNVIVRRIEEKMGLHGSPTCSMGFENATGYLLGKEGRGLAQMFVMITNMRLSVGVMGLGVAGAACDSAVNYANERLQGGNGPKPIAINNHIDVRRQILEIVSKTDVFRGLEYAIANYGDIAEYETDAAAKGRAEALTQWLLPIVKTTGGEIGLEVSDTAMQVLGGAGFTREWPVEQAMRDVRVLTIFEGTTGIQALDLMHRRLLRTEQVGMRVFLEEARTEIAKSSLAEAQNLAKCCDILESTGYWLVEESKELVRAEAGATHFLHLASLAAMGWIALRQAHLQGDGVAKKLSASGRYYLNDIADKALALSAKIKTEYAACQLFDEF